MVTMVRPYQYHGLFIMVRQWYNHGEITMVKLPCYDIGKITVRFNLTQGATIVMLPWSYYGRTMVFWDP